MNVFEQTMAECGYKTKTTFWDDFTTAERFGTDEIYDTYNRVTKEWKSNVEYVTELAMVLNHKIWYWNDKDAALSALYNTLWMELDEWCINNLTGDDIVYYLQTTD